MGDEVFFVLATRLGVRRWLGTLGGEECDDNENDRDRDRDSSDERLLRTSDESAPSTHQKCPRRGPLLCDTYLER